MEVLDGNISRLRLQMEGIYCQQVEMAVAL